MTYTPTDDEIERASVVVERVIPDNPVASRIIADAVLRDHHAHLAEQGKIIVDNTTVNQHRAELAKARAETERLRSLLDSCADRLVKCLVYSGHDFERGLSDTLVYRAALAPKEEKGGE